MVSAVVYSALLVMVFAAALTNAGSHAFCGEEPDIDVLSTGRCTNCTRVQDCQAQLCSCACAESSDSGNCENCDDNGERRHHGNNGAGTYPACLTNSALNCSSATSCVQSYIQCLLDISSSRSNTSDPDCATFGTQVYEAQQNASNSMNDTVLNSSCTYEVCQLESMLGLEDCANMTTQVCSSGNLQGVETTPNSMAPVGPQLSNSTAAGIAALWTAATAITLVVMS
jgi:hypothetical protein